MKAHIFTLLMILGIGLISSCNNEDDNSSQEKNIEGTWYLTNVRDGYGGVVSTDYQKGDIKWVFKQTNNTLVIENNIGSDNNLFLQSGIYNYNIVDYNYYTENDRVDSQIMILENEITMIILPTNNSLKILETNITHGRTAEFKR
tara:strand:+ start:234 stop:668 length:435 start_codon:yes stop_codon:yes gene_type:complete